MQTPKNQLTKELTFHNWVHSLVVRGVNKIGLPTNLSSGEFDSVIIAAIFHDIGYIEKYS